MKERLESTLKKIIKYTLFVAMSLVVLLAVAISLARFFMPSVEQYEQQVANLIAKELQLNVKFDSFAADWYRFGPALKATGIVLTTDDNVTVTEIDTLYISFNVLASLTERKLVPAYLNVIGLNLNIIQNADNSFSIPDWSHSQETTTTTSDEEPNVILNALKKYSSVTLRRSRINFEDNKGELTPIYVRRLIFNRSGKDHQLDLMLNLLNHPTRLTMVAQINGDLAKPKQLAMHGYVELDNVELSAYLQPYTVEDYVVNDGNLDVKAWVDWREGTLQELQADLLLENLEIFSPKQNDLLEPFDINNKFLWQRKSEHEWVLSGDDLEIETDDNIPLRLVNKYELNHKEGSYQFIGKEIVLANVSQILLESGELEEEQQQLLSDLMLEGQLEDITYRWQEKDWQLGATFQYINFQGFDRIPSVINASGEVIANPLMGKLSLDSENTQIDYTVLLPDTLTFNKIKGDVVWQKQDHQWQVKSEDIVLENDELQMHANFDIKGGDELNTYIDANLSIPEIYSLNLYHYLPTAELSPDLTKWLKNSIGPGQLEKLTVKAQGPVNDFPFYDEGNGLFQLQMKMKDLTLNFDPRWPVVEKMNGDFLFLGRQIQIVLDSSQIYQTDLMGVSADIALPADSAAMLHIHGEVVTSAQHAIDFIDHTPLKESVGSSLNAFVFNLPVTMTLDLHIPLSGDEETKVNGLIQVSEGDVGLKDRNLVFTDVQGVFGFTENNMYSQGVQATFLGKPVVMTITPESKNSQHLSHWQLKAEASIDEIKAQFPSDLWGYMQGRSQFDVNFVTGDKQKEGFDLVVTSDLKGIAIDLPAPLTKAADMAANLQYTTTIGLEQATRVRLQYNNLIDAVAQFSSVDGQEVLSGAKIKLGGTLTDLKVPNDVSVSGHLSSFSYDTWKKFLSTLEKTDTTTVAETKPTSLSFDGIVKKIKTIDVMIDHLETLGTVLSKAQVNLTQSAQAWALKLKSNEWAGRMTIPQQGPLTLDFDYCTVNSQVKSGSDKKSEIDPRTVPAINFNCKDFVYNKKSLGKVSVNLAPESSGIKIENLSVTRSNDTLSASGRWWLESGKQKSRMAGQLKSNALDKTLELFDIKSTIIGSKAQADFSLSWPGNPIDFALANLSGELDIRLNKGVVVDINPGFGRILSLLSIQSLERRLRLDFSDVFKKGFSFDQITTLITITDGKAYSDNLLLKAPSAEVKMKGDVNLGTKELNLTAIVIAHISGTLPLAATIASGGNPIVGAVGVGVWAVDKIVKSQGGDAMGSTYYITGTWEKPIVKGKK